MKRDKLKQMLLLTCAAVVAVTITKVYFACSADDDWEGTPEYLMTHAPMQTRATTDAMGGSINGDTIETLVFKPDFTQISVTCDVFGSDATATFRLLGTEGRIVNNSQFTVNISFPKSCLGPGYTTYTLISSSYQTTVNPEQSTVSYHNATTSVSVSATVVYRRQRYISNTTVTDTVSEPVVFSSDLTQYTQWSFVVI